MAVRKKVSHTKKIVGSQRQIKRLIHEYPALRPGDVSSMNRVIKRIIRAVGKENVVSIYFCGSGARHVNKKEGKKKFREASDLDLLVITKDEYADVLKKRLLEDKEPREPSVHVNIQQEGWMLVEPFLELLQGGESHAKTAIKEGFPIYKLEEGRELTKRIKKAEKNLWG